MALSNNEARAEDMGVRLWRQRFTSFARESAAYWRDVARSGFVLVLVAALIGGAYYYGIALKRLPNDFPYISVIISLMAIVLAFGGVRTLVKPADRVYLLPLEGRLGGYFRKAYLYSLILQAGKTTGALMLVWPLYTHYSAYPQPFLLMLATALSLKAGNLYADWQETRLVSARKQMLFRLGRVLLAALIAFIWFGQGYGWAWIMAAIASMLWVFLLYNSRKYFVGLDRLLERDAAQQRRLYQWFRWFTDVPQLPAPVRRRRWLSMVSRRLDMRKEHAFTYLYEKTLLRTELFGMYGLLTLVGAALIWFVSETWLKSTFLVAVPLMGLIQLSALGDAHRYSFWLELYPVQRRLQSSAVLGLIAPLAALQVTMLSLAFAFSAPTGAATAVWPLLSLGAVLLALRFRLRPALRGKFEPETGESKKSS